MNSFSQRFSLLLTLVLVAFSTAITRADEIHVSSKHELLQAAEKATPGSTIVITSKTIDGGISLRNLQGTPAKPIVIRGERRDQRPIIQGGSFGIQLSDPGYVTLENLEVRGASQNGINIDDAGSFDSPALHVTLNNLYVHQIGPDGNCDGIKLSGLDHFTLENCRIERWGKGGSAIDMVGCHHGIVRDCRMEFDTMNSASGVQMKGGTSDILVSYCRFENCGHRGVNIGGSTGLPYFRPQNTTYEAKDITVEDCTFVGGMAAAAFVGVDGAVVQHNNIINPTKWVIRILQETTAPRFVSCRNGVFRNNIVQIEADQAFRSVNVGSNTSPETFQIEGNAWFAPNGQLSEKTLRLPVVEKEGTYNVNPRFTDFKGKTYLTAQNRLLGDKGVRERSRMD